MTFRVGQKVVCVDDHFESGPWDDGRPNLPIAKRIYEIRGMCVYVFGDGEATPSLWLTEIVNPVCNWDGGPGEIPFSCHRFRPVVEKKTDISIFTRMLKTNSREYSESI